MTDLVCSCCGKTPETGCVRLHNNRDVVICYWCLDGLNGQRRRQIKATGQVLLNRVKPIFGVDDVARAIDHYKRLGFETALHDETYGFAEWDGQLTIHLTHSDDPDRSTVGGLYLHVDDAAELADQWRTAGMYVEGPEDFDYGKREGSHTDPDGNVIRFGSPLRD